MDLELNKLESELQSEEATLHSELTKLGSVSAELNRRLGALQQKAERLGDASLASRTGRGAPSIDEYLLSGARDARVAAIQARQRTNDSVKQQLLQVKATLQKLSQQVLADEKSVDQAIAAMQASAQKVVEPPRAPPPPAPPQHQMKPQSDKAPSKRQSPRVKMQAAIDFHSDNNFFNGFSANISDGGLFIATVNLLPLGTEVDLAFTLPSGAHIEAKGVVRWVREVNDQLPDAFPGLGVQFAGLQPQAQSAINEFLAERDPLFFAD